MGIIKDELRRFFFHTSIGAIIGINIAVFVILKLLALFGVAAAPWVMLPSRIDMLLTRPWTLVTYQFGQWELFHLFFNMLWLWSFGSILTRVVSGAECVRLYISGGLVGALAFLLVSWGGAGYLVGSSASVCAIIAAVTFYMPTTRVNLMLFGEVEMRWVGLVALLLIVVSGTTASSAAWAAHLGGAVYGLIYGIAKLTRGIDITNFAIRTRPQATPRKDEYIRRGLTIAEQDELDALLAKVKKYGYGGLSPHERTRLFDVSRKIR